MPYASEPSLAKDQPPCTGVLITNLGTPDAPTPSALKRYLAEFLWDPRVVERPRWLWWPVLHGIILQLRPRKAARAYERIWTDAGSPLLAISRRQEQALSAALQERLAGPVTLALGMRYGNPSIGTALESLRRANAQRILVLPLYPQYSASTTGSTFDAVAEVLRTWRVVPALRMIDSYYQEPGHARALAASVRRHWDAHGRPDRLLFSFHGLPKSYVEAGDPYREQCLCTAHQTATELGLEEKDWFVAFQSRFGPEEWLKPYTDETLKQWGREGMKRVDVIAPGFSADCLETVEEIAEQNRDFFLEAGGKEYHYIPALNDSAEHIDFLADLVVRHCQGW